MQKVEEEQIENIQTDTHPAYEIKKDKLKLLHHAEGNIRIVSVHQTLVEIYDKLFNLNVLYTKSYDIPSNIVLETLPIITYGVNQVKYQNFNIFFKRLTNVDKKFNETSSPDIRSQAADLEKIIFTDLQLFLSYYNYYLHSLRIRNGSVKVIATNSIRNFLNFVYRPVTNVKAFFNDRKVVKEMKRVFNINNQNEAAEFIRSINKKIENYLELVGGKEYCINISNREINSIDLAIYAAVKTQILVLKEDINNLFKFENAKFLVEEIDNLIKDSIHIKNEITVLPPTEYIIPKM